MLSFRNNNNGLYQASHRVSLLTGAAQEKSLTTLQKWALAAASVMAVGGAACSMAYHYNKKNELKHPVRF